MFNRPLIALSITLVISIQTFAQPLAAGRPKFLGAGSSGYVNSIFGTYWNQISPGNDGKWGSVEQTQGVYNWTGLDNIYNYAFNHGLLFKEHTLIWGNQQPSWIASLDSASQYAAIEAWIQKVGERYPHMSLVDVVNEPFHAPPVYKNALGGDGVTGWDWVINAFKLARIYCSPGTKLLLNEYNVLSNATSTTNYFNLISILKDSSLIDGIGIQGHYFEYRSHLHATSNIYVYDVNTLKANLNKLTSLGLPVYITEFDIDEPNDSDQVSQYKIYFPIFWDNPGVKGITFWGYIQNDVWDSYPNTFLLFSNGTERPVMQWLKNYIRIPFSPIPAVPVGTGVPRNPTFSWSASDSASSYHLQLSSSYVFGTIILDTVVSDTSFRIDSLKASSRFSWRISAMNEFGESEFSSVVTFQTGSQFVDEVNSADGLPDRFELFQNYPNPFNPTTSIQYSVNSGQYVSLTVYDVLGRRVATLVNEWNTAGTYEVKFDGSDLSGGIYFYRLQGEGTQGAGGQMTIAKKLVLMK